MALGEQAEVVISVVLYSICSGSLILLNKLILHHMDYPSLVIVTQLVATVLFIYGSNALGMMEIDRIQWSTGKPYLIYTVAFTLGVYFNMRSLSISNVETVIVFRALTPVVVAVLDTMFLGREWPTVRSWIALATISIGAYGYASTDDKFRTQGIVAYFWPFLYLITISFEMAYGRKIIKSADLKTRSGPVQYTNLFGIPPMVCFAYAGGEFAHMKEISETEGEDLFPTIGIFLLVLGCVAAICIGYAGWWCRSKISATSFTIVGVMNKCLTVIMNVLVWDQHATAMGVFSLIVCLVGGAIYQQAPLRKGVTEGPVVKEDDDIESSPSSVEMKTSLIEKK